MAKLAKEKFLVLMVDDTEDDCLQLRITLGKSDRMRFIGSVSDGEELLWYMKGEGKYVDRDKYPLPDRLLLDLALPQKEGFEVLEWLRSQPFDDLVVVVLSGSEKVQDVNKALSLGADQFQPKSGSAFTRQNLVRLLEEYLSHK